MPEKLIVKAGGLLASAAIHAWMKTLDYRAAFYDPTVDPTMGIGGPRIYCFWHEYILFPLFLRGHCNLSMLLSKHRDADVLARVANHFGYESIRGSTYRGAATAVRELLRAGRNAHLAITPDGPRGPRREFAQGPIYLASRLQMPLVVFGLGYDKPWRARSWDRFATPRPFSRARALVSPPLHFDRDLDREGLEAARLGVQSLLRDLTEEAEAWAESGKRMAGEKIVAPIRDPYRILRGDFSPDVLKESRLHDESKRFAA